MTDEHGKIVFSMFYCQQIQRIRMLQEQQHKWHAFNVSEPYLASNNGTLQNQLRKVNDGDENATGGWGWL